MTKLPDITAPGIVEFSRSLHFATQNTPNPEHFDAEAEQCSTPAVYCGGLVTDAG